MKNEENNVVLPPEETVISESRASYKKGLMKFVDGTLTLTNEKLYFKPHKANLTHEVKEISLRQIHATKKEKTLGFIRNRLSISDQEGTEYIFVVKKRNQFIEALDQQLQQL